MNNEFKLLSLKEEKQLTISELEQYYADLRDYLLKRKLTNTTKGATTIAPKLKSITNKITSRVTDILAGGDVVKEVDGLENIPDGPVIFAHTHQGIMDNFAWIPATPKHCIILHSSKVKKLLVLVQLNTGLILVSKEKSNYMNRINAKLDMIELLLKGHSISYFPESAWNLSPNKLHLPMSYGFLDIAKKAGVSVIPVVDELTYDSFSEKERITKIHIRFGEPIRVGIEDDLNEKYKEYSEKIATIRWDLISEKGIFERKNISKKEYLNYLKGNIKNLKMGGIDLSVERQHLWKADDNFYKFHHINDIPFDEKGNFIEPVEIERLKNLEPKINNAFLFNKRNK